MLAVILSTQALTYITILRSSSLVIVTTSLLKSSVSCNASLVRTKHGAQLWVQTQGGHLQYCIIVGRFVKLLPLYKHAEMVGQFLLCLCGKKQKAKCIELPCSLWTGDALTLTSCSYCSSKLFKITSCFECIYTHFHLIISYLIAA